MISSVLSQLDAVSEVKSLIKKVWEEYGKSI